MTSDFEYTVIPPGFDVDAMPDGPNEALAAANRDLLANVRREDGTIVFDTSRGGDILDWQEERAKMSGRFTGDDC